MGFILNLLARDMARYDICVISKTLHILAKLPYRCYSSKKAVGMFAGLCVNPCVTHLFRKSGFFREILRSEGIKMIEQPSRSVIGIA